MFFLARSALCIGVVAAAASGLGTERLATAIDHGARDAAAGAGRACLASSDCLRVGMAALSAEQRRRAPARKAVAEPNRAAVPPGG